MSQHTPEPWIACDPFEDQNGETIVTIGAWDSEHDLSQATFEEESIANVFGTFWNAEANACRIVACVNACAGISTETLEKFGGRAITAEAQRDELLVVLKLAEQWLEGWASAESQLTIIRQAIAKCEK